MKDSSRTLGVVGLVILLILATMLIAFAVSSYLVRNSGEPPVSTEPPVQTQHPLIQVDSPKAGAVVTSPLKVSGQARGYWYFEASFPVRLLDATGKELAVVPVQAQGEWMTEEFVPFKGELKFAQPTTATGVLVFQKDNPSGLPEHDDEYRVPVTFKLAERTVMVYAYNAAADKDAEGNIMCSSKGLVALERKMPSTITPIQDSIRLLLKGELTAAEKARGLTSDFPLAGLELTGAAVDGTKLKLSFADPRNSTSGGSCRVGILRAQIEATAKQFPSVKTVEILPEDLFQP